MCGEGVVREWSECLPHLSEPFFYPENLQVGERAGRGRREGTTQASTRRHERTSPSPFPATCICQPTREAGFTAAS